jgi:hypothetical protein
MKPTSRTLRSYDDLKRSVEAAGVRAEVGWFGGTDGIEFQVEHGSQWSYAFWVGKREPGPILVLPYSHPVYRVTDPGRLTDICLKLLKRIQEGAGAPRVDPGLVEEYGLVPLSVAEFYASENEEKVNRLSKLGWSPVPPEDDALLWGRFSVTFFHPGRSRDQVRVPEGALESDTSPAYVGGAAAEHFVEDLTFKSLRAFREVLRPREQLYSCELSGTNWYFDPRADITDATRASLAVPLLPESDPVFFVSTDFRLGLIGLYPTRRMYIFGDELIEAFHRKGSCSE